MRGAAGLIALLLLASGPLALAQDGGDPLLADDVRFADNLARHRYFDLAADVLAGLRRGELSPVDRGTVDLATATVERKAGEAATDPDAQLRHHSAAIELLAGWAESGTPWANHPRRPDALAELAGALAARGRLRTAQRRPLLDEPGDADRAESLRQLAEADFALCDEVRDQLRDACLAVAARRTEAGQTDEADAWQQRAAATLYDRALGAMDWAELGEAREKHLQDAYSLLGDYQWEQPQESVGLYFAVHWQGVVRRRLGAKDEALALQQEVLGRARWFWDNAQADPATAPYVAELFDRTWGEVASLQAEQGQEQAADETLDAMIAAHAAGHVAFGAPGFEVLLGAADRLAAQGRHSRALDFVKLVADQGATGRPGEEARERLATLITEAGGAGASAAVLLAAARGLADRGDFLEAGFQFTRAAGVLRDDAERAEFLVPAWLGAGRAYAAGKLPLQAALCFEFALDAALAQDGPAELREGAAMGMYDSFDRRAAETKDPFDKALRDEASARLIKLGIAADLAFLKAREAFQAASERTPKDPAAFLDALALLSAVAPDAPSHELSLVYQGRALAGAGRPEEALAAFDRLLARAADPALAPASAEARARRELALGLALHDKADVLLSAAVARPAEALAVLDGFEQKLPGQAALIEGVKFQRVLARALRGEVDAAAEAIADLATFRPGSSYLRLAWFRLSDALLRAHDAARTRGEGPAADALLLRAADALWNSAELAGFPSFPNLLSTGEWYTRARRGDLAQRSYLKALEIFGKEGSSVPAEQLDDARLGLALSWNQTLDFGRATPLWKELEARRPTDSRVLVGAARGYGGWLTTGPDGAVAEVPGSGDYADAVRVWTRLFASAQSSAQHQRIWWESKLGILYAQYRSGAADPAALSTARHALDNLSLLYPDYDEDTLRELPRELQYAPPFKPLFKYLEKRIPKG